MYTLYHIFLQKTSIILQNTTNILERDQIMRNDEVFSRLQNLINYIPMQKEISEKTGIKQNTLSAKSTRNSNWREEEIKKLNEAYNIDIYKAIPQNSTNIDCTDVPVKGDVTASMGYGVTVYEESQTGTYSISNKLAKDIGINLSHSEMIFASGDSMEPTIIGGDSLLIDKSKTEVYDGKIYCVRIDGQIYAKRLQKIPPSKIKVISDNKDKYDAFYVDFSKVIDFDFAILGEVKWWGRVAK